LCLFDGKKLVKKDYKQTFKVLNEILKLHTYMLNNIGNFYRYFYCKSLAFEDDLNGTVESRLTVTLCYPSSSEKTANATRVLLLREIRNIAGQKSQASKKQERTKDYKDDDIIHKICTHIVKYTRLWLIFC